MFSWLRTSATLLACTTLLALGGCGGGGGTGSGSDPTVYFVDASTDAGLIDFLLNEVFQETAMDYLDTSTDFSAIPFISDASGAVSQARRDRVFGPPARCMLDIAIARLRPPGPPESVRPARSNPSARPARLGPPGPRLSGHAPGHRPSGLGD